MSLFGAMMGDLDEDPFFGGQIRRMNQMMNSMFRDPFADMFGGGLFGGPTLMLPGPPGHPAGQLALPGGHTGGHQPRHHRHPANHESYGPGAMAPFGTFPNLRHVFEMANPATGGAQFSSMQVMTMTSGPDGRPQIYQASSSTRHGPNGVRETKKTIADSRTGLKKMSVGHHIHDRAHIIEREQNVYSGDQEERQEFINLDEEEVDTFDNEWKEKTRGMRRNEAIGYGNGRQRHGGPRDGPRNNDMLALPAAPSSTSSSGRVPPLVTPRRSIHSGSSEPKTKAAAIAENSGEERGKKRPVIVEIDSDTDEPKTKSVRRSSEDEVTITEVNSDSEDETASQ